MSSKFFPVLLILSLLLGYGSCQRTVRPVAATSPEELRAQYEASPTNWPAPTLDDGVAHHELGLLDRNKLVPPPAAWSDITVADSVALHKLGKQLFFDPRLSASNQISCGSCHDPDLAWGDGRRRSFGHDRARGLRNAPTLLNAGHWTSLFWDGRATSLEEQTLGPLQDKLEMKESLTDLGPELAAITGYQQLFKQTFGQDSINARRVAYALAAFERRLHSRTSRFDLFLRGQFDALTNQEIRGLHLFRTKARCMNCHNGPLFSDQKFHNQGSHLLGRPEEDLGRYLVTNNWADAGAFRTPTLRDIVFTGPYFHHGNIAELREILQMYNAGMPQVVPERVRKTGRQIPVHDPLLQPLGLTNTEIDDLLAFLGAISRRPQPIRIPEAL